MPKLENVVSDIRNARLKAGISSKALARASGISPSAMSKLEKGRLEPSYDLMYRVTKALHELRFKGGAPMTVEKKMTRDVKTVSPMTRVSEAIKIMKTNGFSQLPVIDKDERIRGLVTEGSLLDNPDAVTCDDAMEKGLLFVGPDQDFEWASEVIKYNSAILVINERKLVGILTKSDFL